MEDVKKYLEPGEQTSPSPKVIEISKSIIGEGFDFVVGVLEWLDQNLKTERVRSDWDELFNKRTASQIVGDGFATGCTDIALAFVSICRAKSIPTKYIEVIGKDWLEGKYQNDKIHGHAFAEIYLNGKWYVIDPDRKTIYATGNPYRFFEIYGIGLDTWDVGLHSFEELKEKFTEFKKNYKPQKPPTS